MRFMLTNDDGVHAPGIQAMAEKCIKAGHEVVVYAPKIQHSGASHSITLERPLRVERIDRPYECYSVDGTPADCAKMGIFLNPKRQFDLVISGINDGYNRGAGCVYSGTVGAALEASMSGGQGLAVSLQDNFGDFGPAAEIGLRVAEWAVKCPLPRGAIYSLNVPGIPYDQIKGIKIAGLSPIHMNEPVFDTCTLEDGSIGYMHGKDPRPEVFDPWLDAPLIDSGYATITQLAWNFSVPKWFWEMDVEL